MYDIKANKSRRATSALYMTGAIAVLTILCTSLLTTSMQSFRSSVKMKENLQAIHLAKAGIKLGREKIRKNPEYEGDPLIKLKKGELEIHLEIINEKKVIVSTGYFPDKKSMRQMKVLNREFKS